MMDVKAGGHAVDAAVAAAFCQGVMNSFASGLGGGKCPLLLVCLYCLSYLNKRQTGCTAGNFMLIRLANGSSLFINAREQAPSAARPGMFSGVLDRHWDCKPFPE